jgi:hypothetical protein
VSSVAKDKSSTGAAHGARVSAAAKSDCGKKSTAPAEPVEPVEDDVAEQAAAAQAEAERQAAHEAEKAEQAAAHEAKKAAQAARAADEEG